MSAQALQLASQRAKELSGKLPASSEAISGLNDLITYLDESFAKESLAEEGRGFDEESLQKFLGYARRGKGLAASGGEARCFRLASMLRKHLDDCCGLDSYAQLGFIEIFRAANLDYYTVQGWLKGMDGKRR